MSAQSNQCLRSSTRTLSDVNRKMYRTPTFVYEKITDISFMKSSFFGPQY